MEQEERGMHAKVAMQYSRNCCADGSAVSRAVLLSYAPHLKDYGYLFVS